MTRQSQNNHQCYSILMSHWKTMAIFLSAQYSKTSATFAFTVINPVESFVSRVFCKVCDRILRLKDSLSFSNSKIFWQKMCRGDPILKKNNASQGIWCQMLTMKIIPSTTPFHFILYPLGQLIGFGWLLRVQFLTGWSIGMLSMVSVPASFLRFHYFFWGRMASIRRSFKQIINKLSIEFEHLGGCLVEGSKTDRHDIRQCLLDKIRLSRQRRCSSYREHLSREIKSSVLTSRFQLSCATNRLQPQYPWWEPCRSLFWIWFQKDDQSLREMVGKSQSLKNSHR